MTDPRWSTLIGRAICRQQANRKPGSTWIHLHQPDVVKPNPPTHRPFDVSNQGRDSDSLLLTESRPGCNPTDAEAA